MNKKFSTFMTTGLLLSGALFCNVNAAEKAKTITFDKDSIGYAHVVKGLAQGDTLLINGKQDLSNGKKYFIIATPGVTVIGKNATDSIIGRMVVTAENVTVKNLTVVTNPVSEDANGYWTKTALTAFADKLSVDGCLFTTASSASGTIANGIVLYPQTSKTDYAFTGNTFKNLRDTVAGKNAAGDTLAWYSSAIQIYKNTKVETKSNDSVKIAIDSLNLSIAGYGSASAAPAVDAAAIVAASTFNNCVADMVVRNGNELDGNTYSVEYLHATKYNSALKAAATALSGNLIAPLVDAIQNSTETTTIDTEGVDAQELASLLTDASQISTEVAKTLKDKDVIINTEKNGESQALVLGEPKNAPENAINLVISATGTVTAYAAELPSAAAGSGDFLLLTKDGMVLKAKTDGKADKVALDSKNPELFVWNLQYDAATSQMRFYNAKAKVFLHDDNGTLVGAATTNKKVGPANVVLSTSNAVAGVASSTEFALGVYAAPSEGLEAGDLRSIFGSSFMADIEFKTDDKKVDKTLENNPFKDTNLKPVQWKTVYLYNSKTKEYDIPANSYDYTYELEPAKADTAAFMLQKDNGKLIVMQVENMYSSTNPTGKDTYRIVEIDPKDLATSLKNDEYKYASIFTLNAAYDFEAGVNTNLKNITVTGDMTDDATVYVLGSVKLSNKNTLTAVVKGETIDAITIKLSTYRRLSVEDMMTGKFYTIANKNTKKQYSSNFGKVLGLNNYGNAEFMKESDVLFNYPETQWAATADTYRPEGSSEDAVRIKLTNRENPEGNPYYIYPENCYKTDDTDIYAYSVNPYAPYESDTLEIKAVETTPADGFFRFADYSKLKDLSFHMGSYSAVRDTAYVTENHKENHQVGLEKEKADATAWRIVPLMFQKEDAWNNVDKDVKMVPDTICVVSNVGILDEDGKPNVQQDTLKILAFAFKNIENDEFMAYDGSRDRYTTGNESSKTGYNAQGASYFALKIMGNADKGSLKYNLVEVDHYTNSGNYAYNQIVSQEDGKYIYIRNNDNEPYTVKNLSQKAYAGETSAKGIVNQYGMYQQNESDLFTLTQKESAQYLSFGQGDVIKIFRSEYAESESNVLYEKGEFLGVGNAVENNKINPAIYVDPIDGSKDHPEYLLAVNAIHKDTTYTCNEPSHAGLIHSEDTTWGRFLVNLTDSAIVTDGKDNIHVNKYTYIDGSTPYVKLGFVQGVCSNDTLFHVDTVAAGVASEYKITEAPQLFKFAFRVVDPAENIKESTFVLETGYKYPSDLDNDVLVGYLRYINGNIVVTRDIRQAEVFKLKEDSRTPTANDVVTVSEVSVIAGNGYVTVKGAAGKTVVINNVLGQTIASTVLSSDNATIAVPAGIVVVAVEGEAAVKAIVK